MSANKVIGTDPQAAVNLDAFWDKLSPEHRSALHTAFNVCSNRPGYESSRNASEMLRNAESGRHGISSVRGDFFRFMEARIAKCPDAESMLTAILTYGKLSPEEQETKFFDSGE